MILDTMSQKTELLRYGINYIRNYRDTELPKWRITEIICNLYLSVFTITNSWPQYYVNKSQKIPNLGNKHLQLVHISTCD